MERSPDLLSPAPPVTTRWSVPDLAGLGLTELGNASSLRAQILPTGALFALRHGETLLNQVLPGPAENGLFRLLIRWHEASRIAGGKPLVGAGIKHRPGGGNSFTWINQMAEPELACTSTLQLHPFLPAWIWHVVVRNDGDRPRRIDVMFAQDLGLADEGAVRNNEAYTSHYIDLLPVSDPALGWTILARQNQAMNDGCHPWLAFACVGGADAYCTDGWQFFGADHRLTGAPVAAGLPRLPSGRLQYECALAGLQSRMHTLAPGETTRIGFIARFIPDHPAPSSIDDLTLVRELLPALWSDEAANPGSDSAAPINAVEPSLFVTSPWLHGDAARSADLAAWFPGEHRHVESGADGTVLSFFHGACTHVVTQAKEAAMLRPHGHILRSGNATWIDERQFGLTCHAAGVFATQAYLGNPSFARLLPVWRSPLNITRGGGQRVFVRMEGNWQQLGVPSAFALTPGDVRWIYRRGEMVIEARTWCSLKLPASFLELRVTSGSPCEFLISHELLAGSLEYQHGAAITVHALDGWLQAEPSDASLVGTHEPGTSFAIAATQANDLLAIGGDELLHAGEGRHTGAYAVVRTRPVHDCGVIMLGVLEGPSALPAAIAAARSEYAGEAQAAQPPPLPLRVHGTSNAGIARLNDVLPWFHHNAAIHFSAPHGLEQTGGAAWGVRDVCQGSMEWLLTTGQLTTARRVLEVVFAQQSAVDGTWPQWFMHPPYASIRQAHAHGDVCFWPVKALCDYLEASNDLGFLDANVPYADATDGTPVQSAETLWSHCDRVVAHAESRFVPGTALINYGDGDWDDTLQPADPMMRTRMISTWTVALAFHTFRQLSMVCRRAKESARPARLDALLARMREDFHAHLMPGGIVAGFLLNEAGGARPLLHPTDRVTGIRYRLLPMTRAVLAELFTLEEARQHLDLVEKHLLFPDGVRLMSEPVPYHGGCERLFKRADTAANVGREIGLQYVHAHLRYAEAMARVGDAEALWHALQVVNPVGLASILPQAAPRQSNTYFSSSDADFADRYEATARWPELRPGRISVRGGWRLYSSGPGLFLHKVRTCLLGVRESFGDVIFDPVLPRQLDGLIAELEICGAPVEIRYSVQRDGAPPFRILVNEQPVPLVTRDSNPYRISGPRIPAADLRRRLQRPHNVIVIEC